MFDKILEKAEEAMTRLSKTLSIFDQDSTKLKAQFEEQVAEYHKKVDSEISSLTGNLSKEIAKIKEQSDQIVLNQSLELAKAINKHKEDVLDIVDKSLQEFSKVVKDRFESLYAEYEAEAVRRAEASFESDIPELFKKYGDKIAPYLEEILKKRGREKLKRIFMFWKK